MSQMKPKLTIELVPSTCWLTNLRSELPKSQWDQLRKATYRKANYRCEVCGGKGDKHPVECHEIWHYDDANLVQSLKGLIALYPACHQVKHIGLAKLRGKGEEAANHLKKVNGWNERQTQQYILEAFKIWNERSKYQWQLDLTWLEQNGITLEK
jgi:hypothetical protein